jgi:hypothetical protein
MEARKDRAISFIASGARVLTDLLPPLKNGPLVLLELSARSA